jgi:hypothetical protein
MQAPGFCDKRKRDVEDSIDRFEVGVTNRDASYFGVGMDEHDAFDWLAGIVAFDWPRDFARK